MSTLALTQDGQLSPLEPALKPVRDNVKAARDYRKRNFESNWQLNLAYRAGQHWVGFDNQTRTLRSIQELNARYRSRELVTADVITEYCMTALGELGSDNDRPNLLLRHDDTVSGDYQDQLNKAVGYAWDHEIDADSVLAQVDRYIVDLGTAAVRCFYDRDAGQTIADNVPFVQGQPVLNPADAAALFQNGPTQGVTMGPLKQGKICWEPLSAFHILAQPGVTHERDFTYDCVIRPAPLADVKARYGDVAQSLSEDRDISTSLGVQAPENSSLNPSKFGITDAKTGTLRGHVWLVDYYERPTGRYPRGRRFTLATNDLVLVDYADQLDYVKPDGSYCSGVTYFHWWRVTGRFYSRSLVDVLRPAQFLINKRRTQTNEIIDKSLPYVIVEKNSETTRKKGLVMEMVEVGPAERVPQPVQGVGPGPWMQGDVESLREDLQHASGINGPRRGENPANISTYSQLALINELDTAKREPIYLERKRGIASLLEDTVYDIRTYWGPDRQIALAGEDDQLEAAVFDATRIPPFFIVEIGKGQAKPRSQAAELQKVTDIWNAALASGATQASPGAYLRWFKDSIAAGEALELPAEGSEDPAEKADYENHYMSEGVPMPIAYYDIHAAHLPRHRRLQDQAMFEGNQQLWQLVEQHCQLHMAAAAAQAQAQLEQMQQAQMAQGLHQTMQAGALAQAKQAGAAKPAQPSQQGGAR